MSRKSDRRRPTSDRKRLTIPPEESARERARPITLIKGTTGTGRARISGGRVRVRVRREMERAEPVVVVQLSRRVRVPRRGMPRRICRGDGAQSDRKSERERRRG